MEIPTLQTDRLLLRPFSAADVDAYAELNANQEVMGYIDKVQDREAAFRSLCANIGHWHVRGYGPWAVEDRATGRLIGRATQRSTLAGCSCPQVPRSAARRSSPPTSPAPHPASSSGASGAPRRRIGTVGPSSGGTGRKVGPST